MESEGRGTTCTLTLVKTMTTLLDGAQGCHGGGERKGGSAGDAKRRERAARKIEQKEMEAAARVDDGSSIMTLTYSFQDPVGEIRINEDWSGEGNGIAGLQWPGGVVLSRYMDCRQVFPDDYFVGRRVIEVGAGCGLTSIYAALRGADVTITDVDTAKCVDNVEINLQPRIHSGKASVRRLEWGCAEELALFEPPYDMVIAGDCLYEEECISPLLKTMWALSGPNTEILLSGVVGHGILASFLRKADEYFERETVDTSKVDTLAAVVVPLGNATELAKLDPAASMPHATPGEVEDGQTKQQELAAEPEGEIGVAAVMRAGLDGAPCTEPGLARPAQAPGQRALLRLRKKCYAGAGE